MKMKKILCIAIAFVMVVGLFAGCESGILEDTGADISAFVDNDEKLELSWLGYAMLAGCEEGTASELLMEDKFNVEIKPIFTEAGNYTDKKNALLQAGDIPDLIYELDPMNLFADARDEFLFEVPYEAVEKYAPSLYANIKDKAPAVWMYSYYDGKNYGVPNINYSHMASRTIGYRGDWLKKFNLEVPETLDELHTVLDAFVHRDPDGNGKNDTYGYTIVGNEYQYYFADIFGAYGILPFDWQEVNGEIVYGGLRQECEDVLALLAQWHSEGLIYQGFVEVDKSADKLFRAELSGIAHDYSLENPELETSALYSLKQNTPEAEIVYGKPVKGPNGDAGMRSWGYPCHAVAFGANGDLTPVKVTRMLKMFETIYSDDALFIELRAGKEGVVHNVNNDTKGSSVIEPTADYTEYAQRRLAGYEFSFAGPSFFVPFAPKQETYESTQSTVMKDFQAKYQSEELCLTDAFYKFDIIPSAATYYNDVNNMQRALMSQIIKGEKSADQYIEEFTKIWESTGGVQMLEEAKTQSNVIEEIYKKIGIKSK